MRHLAALRGLPGGETAQLASVPRVAGQSTMPQYQTHIKKQARYWWRRKHTLLQGTTHLEKLVSLSCL